MISLVAVRLHRLFHRPAFLLDENIGGRNGGFPRCQCVLARQIVKEGTPDEVLLEEATRRNLTVVTNDVKFVLKAVLEGKNIIYENNDGFRFYISGKSTRIIDKVDNRNSMAWPKRKQKRMLEFANRTSLHLSYYGFYQVDCF